MSEFKVHSTLSAPAAVQQTLSSIENDVGFVPNIYRLLAETPHVLDALMGLNKAMDQSSLTPLECEIIALTTSVFNACPYCVAGHSTFAAKLGLSEPEIEAIRNGGFASHARLHAIGRMTVDVLERRGAVGTTHMRRFLNAGFEPMQLLELVTGIAAKTMTNFASKFSRLPLDEKFQARAWSPNGTPETQINQEQEQCS